MISRQAAPIPAAQAGYLIRVAARAPSLHNTQPWRFKVTEQAIELYADHRRQLPEDPAGREMLISCGAALYGLRLAVRSLSYVPEVDLLPGPAGPGPVGRRRPLARVRLGPTVPMTSDERKMLAAVPHRHTHRGPFEPGPLPAGLLQGLQQDALAEGATLTLVEEDQARQDLAAIVAAASLRQTLDPASRAETERWTRGLGSLAKDGVPAHAFPPTPDEPAGWLPPRDFDLGRGLGRLPAGEPPAPVTAVLATSADHGEDWLRAGQALHRMLLHAASQWVFGNLQTQPLKVVWVRAAIRNQLTLPGWPQMLLQLGVARTTLSTARRPPAELIDP
jgi:nitroreductase